MASKYRIKNSEGTIDLFLKRKIYMGALLNSIEKYPNLVNFNFGERVLFGRVDLYFVPIVLNSAYINYEPRSSSGVPRAGAINFVLDAFRTLSALFDKARGTGKISSDDPYLSDLRIFKGYQDPNKMYTNYFKAYYNVITSNFKKDPYPPLNFEEFINKLLPMILRSARQQPFTKTGFIKSRHCPIACSGLSIEIADLSYANDQDKVNKFINSKNWDFYVNACNSCGFMIDRQIPWRLVADVGNPEYLTLFVSPWIGARTKQTMFNKLYNPAHEDYYRAFKYYLLKLYNGSRRRRVRKTEYCQNSGRQIQYMINSRSYEQETFADLIPEEYFLKIYFQIRFMEEECLFTEQQEQNIIQEITNLYVADPDKLNVWLFLFEFIINKTVDYIGSASYIKKAMEEIRSAIPKEEPFVRRTQKLNTALQDGKLMGPPSADDVG